MNPNERSSHPSRAQIEALLQYLEKHPSLAKGFSKVASARDAARKHWERLTIQLNSMGGSVKTWKQWTKYWADKKSAVKKKAALRAAVPRRTGGGVEEVVEISEVEERIIFLMGGESFAIGDRHLAIDPFSEPQELLPASASAPLSLGEVAPDTTVTTVTTVNPIADTICIPGTSYPSVRQSYAIPDVSTETRPALSSPQRTPPIVLENPDVQTPSRQGAYPIRASPTPLHQHLRNSPPPSQLPPRHTSPRRRARRRLIPPSPPSQRRSQLTSTTDRFLRLEEQRLQLERRNTEILAAVNSSVQIQMEHLSEANRAIASALNALADALKMLAERR